MFRKTFVLAVILLSITQSIWSTDWQYAPGAASQGVSNIGNLMFRDVKSEDSIGDYPPGGEGWIWLRAFVSTSDAVPYLVFEGPELAWTAWWNDDYLASSGNPPYNWTPSTALPLRINTDTSPTQSIIVIKAFVKQGYAEFPRLELSDSPNPWSDTTYQIAILRYFTPIVACLFGLLLAIGGGIAFLNRRLVWDGAMAFFGFFALLVFGDSILTYLPGVTSLFSWTVILIISELSIPFLLTTWRRSVGSAGRKDPLVLSIVDYLFAVIVAVWLGITYIQELQAPWIPAFVFQSSPLALYSVWSITWAVVLWISHTAGKRDGRLGSLVVLLVSIIPGLLLIRQGFFTITAFIDYFLYYGIVASLIISVPVIMARKLPGILVTPKEPPFVETAEDDEDEEILELEVLDETTELVLSKPIRVEPIEEINTAKKPTAKLLIRSLRSTMYPESMPWDPIWELGSARQGSSHPATGFHDIYQGEDGRISGFSFMDSGSDSLESTFLAHLVQSELNRRFTASKTLPGIARSVHRKAVTAAGAAGRVMKGVIGRLDETKITFVPMAMPSMILKRANGALIPLPPEVRGDVNPPIGSNSYGESGIKTMSVSMHPGDSLMVYTPSITDTGNSAGASWGIKGLVSSFKHSEAHKPEGVVAEIISDLKDFAGKDELDGPLQLLIIKRR